MALLLADGFDIYDSVDDAITSGWSRESSSLCTFSASNGRFGGGCLEVGGTTDGWVVGTNVPQGGTLICCFAFRHTGGGNANQNLWRLGDDSGSRIAQFELEADGSVEAFGAAGSLGAAAGNITANVWHWIEIVVVHGTNATDGTVTLYIDEVQVHNFTGIDTNTTTARVAARMEFGGISGSTCRIDDVIVMDGTGATMNGILGDSRIDPLNVNADGGTVDWAANGAAADYLCVDDALGSSNGDTDYISSATAGQESRFDFSPLSENPTIIHSVQLRVKARKDNAGARTVRGVINSSANEATGPTLGLTTDYSWRRCGAFDRNPNGDVVWNKAAVDALQAGIEVVS